MGEWDGERTWYRGDPPARRPLPILVGDVDCIRYGEKPGLPIQTNISAECGKPLPDACYGLEDEIFALTNVWDCVFAKRTADVLDKAYTDLDAAADLVTAFMPAGTLVATFPQPNNFVPAAVIASISDTVVLWLTGTTNFQQLAAQAFYLNLGQINVGAYSTSALNEGAMLAIAALLNALGLGNAGRIVLCGHSFGGAVCMVLAARMMTADPNRLVEILTLGAPAPGDARLHALIELLAQRHYANERDPIPYLPPRGLQFAGLFPIIGALLGVAWQRFVRPPQTKQITQDGRFVDVRTPDLPDDYVTAAVAAIAAALDVPSFKDHRTDWYSYYLCLACRCVPRPCVPPGGELLGFDFILEELRWLHDGVELVENFAANLPYEALDDIWVFREEGIARVVITPFYDVIGNYSTFRIEYQIAAPGPLDVPFVWTFPAIEMIPGIDTSTQPEFDPVNPADVVLAMGRLVIPSSYGFPPIDGGDVEGFLPIFEGDEPPP